MLDKCWYFQYTKMLSSRSLIVMCAFFSLWLSQLVNPDLGKASNSVCCFVCFTGLFIFLPDDYFVDNTLHSLLFLVDFYLLNIFRTDWLRLLQNRWLQLYAFRWFEYFERCPANWLHCSRSRLRAWSTRWSHHFINDKYAKSTHRFRLWIW